MDIIRFREIISERERISEETNDEWDYGVEKCWKEEIEILAADISSTIEFLKNECTEAEYSWISEVIEDLVSKVNNKQLVECYVSLMKKYPQEYEKYNIKSFNESIMAMVDMEGNDGKEG